MATLSGLLGAAGSRPTLTLSSTGKVFTVGVLTQKVKTAFARITQEREIDLVEYLAARFPEKHGHRVERLYEVLHSDDFDFHGGVCIHELGTVRGRLLLMRLLLDATEDEFQALLLEHGDDLKRLVSQALEESTPRRDTTPEDEEKVVEEVRAFRDPFAVAGAPVGV